MSGVNNCAVLNVQSQCDGVMVPDDHERRGDGLGGGLAVAADIPRFVAAPLRVENLGCESYLYSLQNYKLVVWLPLQWQYKQRLK